MKVDFAIPYNAKPAFLGATLNINAFSDSHGSLDKANDFYTDMDRNKGDIFLKDEKGNQNALVIAGDWFISGTSRGYKSNPKFNSHDYQIRFFNEFVQRVKDISSTKTKTYLVPGNHELDGGEDEFAKVSNNINAKILMTNLDFNNSPTLQKQINSGKIVQSDVMEIEDDKDPTKTHKVLFVGVNPVNMPYYNRELKGINFLSQPFKSQKAITKEDYRESLDETKRVIEEFKKENPKGLVIASVHTGADFAENLANELGDKISIIFDGHEHKDKTTEVNGVKIVKLSQNFKKYVNVKFFIDDDGNLKQKAVIKPHYPNLDTKNTTGFFYGFYTGLFFADLDKEYKITPKDPNVDVLDVENVRTSNSYLANFITDSILSKIKEDDPDVDIFAINASAMRHSLETKNAGGTHNLNVIAALSGIIHNEAWLFKNEVTGAELLDIITDNLLFNEKSPERNPLMQYSGVIIDKKGLLDAYHNGITSDEELKKFVKLAKTGETLDTKGKYTIANVEKFYKKSKNPFIGNALYSRALPLNKNARDLFLEYMDENKENLTAKCDTRIID